MPARRRARGEQIVEVDVPDDLYEEEIDEEVIDEDEEPRRPGDGARRRLTAATVGRVAVREIAELTARETEGVTFVQPKEDGWLVGVEVVEDRRVPSSGDVLALYEVELDREGDLLSYRRTRRYRRGRGDSEGP
ncbi:gas vesicle protein GvpO [Streptosporangium algeriense]|uniref:Gas vesicle protein GvpO n=1 Tax=Streptosporangium algeriense TaxID=1682748 RepID=A0ABW3DUZ6_9ACTN